MTPCLKELTGTGTDMNYEGFDGLLGVNINKPTGLRLQVGTCISLDIFVCNIALYCIDRSVLLENTPLVKFIRNYIRDSSGVFSTSLLVRILMTSFSAFPRLFVQTVGEKWQAMDLSI